MRAFSHRVFGKISKLSREQIDRIFFEQADELESYDAIFNSLSTGLLICDKDGFLRNFNKSAERFLPFSIHLEDAKSEKIKIWDAICEKDISDFLKSCFSKNKTNVTEEFTVSTLGGTVRFLDIFVLPFVKENQISGSIIKIDDVTEVKNSQILARRMENLASLTNLAASMAHEIKNPLGAISIHIQLLQKTLKKARENEILPDKKFTDDCLAVVNEEIARLNKTVVDFLFAVRPVSARLELLNPNKLISSACDFFAPEFEEKGIKILVFLCDEGEKIRILLDQKLFRDVLVNLAQNSLSAIQSVFYNAKNQNEKKSCAGGILKIETFLKAEKDLFVIEFSDNGCGMSKETAAKIFEPYFTTKADGTGLGMTTSYKIIKEFGGEISVSSKIDSGTKFTISLPIPQSDVKSLVAKKSETK